MPENDVLPEGAPEPGGSGTIDLAKYRSGDLADRVVDLVGVPKAFRRIAKTAALGALLSVVACCLIFHYSQMTAIPLLVVCAYALVMGVVFGVVLAVLGVLATAAKSVDSILRIVFEITGDVAKDYERIQSGSAQLPSGGELVEQVYEGVVLPVMDKAVAGAFGFLSAPLLWIYHRTVGLGIRYVIKRMARSRPSSEEEQKIAVATTGGMAAVAKDSETIRTYTSSAAELVGSVGGKIRFFAMLPLYVAFAVSLTVAVVPIVLVWLLTGVGAAQ